MARNGTQKKIETAPDADTKHKLDAVPMAMDAIEKQYGR